MITLAKLAAMFAGNGLKFAAAFGVIAMLGTWDWKRIRKAENRGAESVRVETKKANDATVKTSQRVRAKSNSGSVRGQRDPYTAD